MQYVNYSIVVNMTDFERSEEKILFSERFLVHFTNFTFAFL